MKGKFLKVLSVLACLTLAVGFAACGDSSSGGNNGGGNEQVYSGELLTLTKNIEGAGTVSGGGRFEYNEDLYLEATTNSGYYFLGWYYGEELLSPSATYNCKMWDKSVTIEAKFTSIPDGYSEEDFEGGMQNAKFSLEINASPSIFGQVKVDDGDYTTTYTRNVSTGTTVDVVALTLSSQRFLGWYDSADNLVMTNAKFSFSTPPFDYELTAKWLCDGDHTKIVCDVCGRDLFAEYAKQGFVVGLDEYDYVVLNEYVGNKKSVVIPDGIKRIGDNAFQNCSNLTEVSIPESVYYIGKNAFQGCVNLTEFTIPESISYIGDKAFLNCTGLQEVSAFENQAGLTLGKEVFAGCENIITVEGPAKVVKEVRLGSERLQKAVITSGEIFDSMFADCINLTEVVISGSVFSIGDYAFSGCSGLKEITIPSCVGEIGDYAFSSCSGLKEITIPSSVRIIGDYVFKDCISLTSVQYNATDVAYIRSMFEGVGQLGEELKVIIGANVRQIPAGLFTASNITSVLFEKGSVCENIGSDAFAYCYGLTEIVIPDSVTNIGSDAFYNCSGLKSVVIGDSVTEIGDGAFCRCDGLIEIVISDSVKSIGEGAFVCDDLTTIYYGGTEEEWENISVDVYNPALKSTKKYYYRDPKSSLFDDCWSDYYWCYDENDEIVLWYYDYDGEIYFEDPDFIEW